ncbi:sensor histidine kinase [Actinacidiphila sp. bgisy145]|uniref:sensor histidine kinase n=1 Tax=Actinacidiphila sp. bgisy145 TaxID=3413792 RepID=UPI003EBDF525
MHRLRATAHWLAQDNNLLQLFISGTGIAVCAVLVHPRGTSGTGLVVLCLLVLNSLLLTMRLIPEGALSPGPQTALLCFGGVAAAALMSQDHSGAASLFAFYLAGHAGFRLERRRALAVAAVTAVMCAAVRLFPIGSDPGEVPWYLGVLAGTTVLVGISNRLHAESLRSARSAAEQAELAARAEARAEALAERARIARDVHDVLAHSLAGVNMQLEVADALLESGAAAEARQATQRAQSLVRAGLTEVQRTVRDLREDALPLLDTLRSMLGSIPGTGTLTLDGPPHELPVRPAQVIVRCAQEALTNAHKYAPGAPVRLHLAYGPEATTFEVVNSAPPDGSRPLAGAGSGMGLVGMRERVELVGGTVTAGPIVDGDDAGGWQVRVVIPA